MPDIETTIGNLEQNIRWIEEIECHQFPGWANVTMAMRDAVELLKEQKSVRTYKGLVYCGSCNHPLMISGKQHSPDWKYCAYCGRRVKWND